jgi:hypothetical protein
MTQPDPVLKEVTEALNKHNLQIGYEISFPRYNIMPDEVRLALNVLQRHGMKITISLVEANQKR